MKTHKILTLTLAVLVAALVAGCKPIMPEVNEENCNTESVAKIEDDKTQYKFAALCARGGVFKTSDENCDSKSLLKILNKEAMYELSGACSRSSGPKFRPSPQREWSIHGEVKPSQNKE